MDKYIEKAIENFENSDKYNNWTFSLQSIASSLIAIAEMMEENRKVDMTEASPFVPNTNYIINQNKEDEQKN